MTALGSRVVAASRALERLSALRRALLLFSLEPPTLPRRNGDGHLYNPHPRFVEAARGEL